jgi:hypothetical protein
VALAAFTALVIVAIASTAALIDNLAARGFLERVIDLTHNSIYSVLRDIDTEVAKRF